MINVDSSSSIVEIVAVDHEGRGIAYQDDKTIFVENSLLGEKLTYKIYKKKNNNIIKCHI